MPWVDLSSGSSGDAPTEYLASVLHGAMRPFPYRRTTAELLGFPGLGGDAAVPALHAGILVFAPRSLVRRSPTMKRAGDRAAGSANRAVPLAGRPRQVGQDTIDHGDGSAHSAAEVHPLRVDADAPARGPGWDPPPKALTQPLAASPAAAPAPDSGLPVEEPPIGRRTVAESPDAPPPPRAGRAVVPRPASSDERVRTRESGTRTHETKADPADPASPSTYQRVDPPESTTAQPAAASAPAQSCSPTTQVGERRRTLTPACATEAAERPVRPDSRWESGLVEEDSRPAPAGSDAWVGEARPATGVSPNRPATKRAAVQRSTERTGVAQSTNPAAFPAPRSPRLPAPAAESFVDQHGSPQLPPRYLAAAAGMTHSWPGTSPVTPRPSGEQVRMVSMRRRKDTPAVIAEHDVLPSLAAAKRTRPQAAPPIAPYIKAARRGANTSHWAGGSQLRSLELRGLR
jgi:hypothetical protein